MIIAYEKYYFERDQWFKCTIYCCKLLSSTFTLKMVEIAKHFYHICTSPIVISCKNFNQFEQFL